MSTNFFDQFLKKLMMVYIFVKSVFVAVACLYLTKWPRAQLYTSPPKKSVKNSNQKCDKCFMKAALRQVLSKTSLFKVLFSKR